MEEKVVAMFGEKYKHAQTWSDSFDYIENFIKANVVNWDKPPDTPALVAIFEQQIKQITDLDFVFLLIHTGYIPEIYEHDSSQETLYSKLVECVVCEWAKRIGFTESHLQTQKSSKEDVTIKKGDQVIVTDAKSFRLGRSQAAPNVKDTIKKADYEKWLESYKEEHRIGGLITFPSLHTWAKSTDVFLYTSDMEEPIMLLFYEQLAFFYYSGLKADDLMGVLEKYSEIHPTKTKSPEEYFRRKLPRLFGASFSKWEAYMEVAEYIIRAKVRHTIKNIEALLAETKQRISTDVAQLDELTLRKRLIEAEMLVYGGQLIKNLKNIKKFRPH